MKKLTTSGYIFMTTLMIISVATFLVMYLASKADMFSTVARGALDREKASALAYSGVQIAMSQLATAHKASTQEQEKKDAAEKDPEAKAQKQMQNFLQTIIPVHARWQTFALQKERDGMKGQIKMCLVSEEGKININQVYDFKNKKFKGEGQEQGDYKKSMQALLKIVETTQKTDNLFSAVEAFLKKQKIPLDDVTQLIAIPELSSFKEKLFYEPIEKKDTQKKQTLFLTDIFTTHSDTATIQPWLLSESMRGILGLKRTVDTDPKQELPFKKATITTEWKTHWDTLVAPLYGKKFANISAPLTVVLSPAFEPKVFSVLSYGKFGKITQKLLAILERSTVSEQGSSEQFKITIKKLYWL